MHVLTINCGSSSVKLKLIEVDLSPASVLASGSVESIGPTALAVFRLGDDAPRQEQLPVDSYKGAIRLLLRRMPDEARKSIDAVGHRVVHGGRFSSTVLINAEVIQAIHSAERLAPLHNRPALEGIAAAQHALPAVPQVAVFDTSFHTTLPEQASRYALPDELAVEHGIRRYGYHGIAHRSMMERYAALAGVHVEQVSLITLQLGNGCSATAIRDGISVDTSMGFTPLEGLIMGTRPGDVDPGVLIYLLRNTAMTPADLDHVLNHRSGLVGISGTSADMAVLLTEEAEGDPRAQDAIEMFCYRIRKYIGAYVAVLGHVDAVVFGGGIGERSAEIRRRVCEPLSPLGLRLDIERNGRLNDGEGRVSGDDSTIAAWVIPSDEERIIADETFNLLRKGGTV